MEGWAFINLVLGGGWPPNLMDEMSLEDFARWYQLASERNDHLKREMER